MTLTGRFFYGTYRDAGFPPSDGNVPGVPNISVRAYIGVSGSYQYLEPIDRFAPVSKRILDYPGGNVVWNFGTEEVAHTNPTVGGIWSYGLDQMRIDVVLMAK